MCLVSCSSYLRVEDNFWQPKGRWLSMRMSNSSACLMVCLQNRTSQNPPCKYILVLVHAVATWADELNNIICNMQRTATGQSRRKCGAEHREVCNIHNSSGGKGVTRSTEPSPTRELLIWHLEIMEGGRMWPRLTMVSSTSWMAMGEPGLVSSIFTSKKSFRFEMSCT